MSYKCLNFAANCAYFLLLICQVLPKRNSLKKAFLLITI